MSYIRAPQRKLCGAEPISLAVGASAGGIVGFLLWMMVGRERSVFRFLHGCVDTLPTWLYFLIHLLAGFMMGLALSAALFDRRCHRRHMRYQGAFYLLCAVLLAGLYHIFFFGKLYFLASAAVALIECSVWILALLLFRRGFALCTLMCGGCFLWACYRFLFSFFCIFCI